MVLFPDFFTIYKYWITARPGNKVRVNSTSLIPRPSHYMIVAIIMARPGNKANKSHKVYV